KWDFEGAGIKHSAANPINRNGGGFNIGAANNGVVNKLNQNANIFPSGYVTTDDSFVNNATRPLNAAFLEWRGNDALAGTGTRAFGRAVANSRRFSQCMAKRVFKSVCRKELDETVDKVKLKAWGDEFEASGYKLKKLFEDIAVKSECL